MVDNSPVGSLHCTFHPPLVQGIQRVVTIKEVNFMSIVQVASSTVKQMVYQVHGLS